jgi:hypothetical protein
MKDALRGRHDLGEIVGYAYRLYIRNFAPLISLALLTVPTELLIGVVGEGAGTGGAAYSAAQLLTFVSLAVGLIAAAGMIVATHDITGGTRPEFSRSLDAALSRAVDVLSTFLLAVLLALGALLSWPWLGFWWLLRRDATIDGRRDWWLVVFPLTLLIYLAVRWQLWQQGVMIEGKRNWAALDASAAVVRGSWWRTLGILLVVAAIQFGPILLASAARELPPLPGSLLSGAVLALVLPFAVIAQTLLYYDLKARSHAPDRTDGVAAAGPDVQGEGA